MKFGSVMSCAPSSFLKEFDPTLIEQEDLRELMSRPVEESRAVSGFAALRAAISGK